MFVTTILYISVKSKTMDCDRSRQRPVLLGKLRRYCGDLEKAGHLEMLIVGSELGEAKH